MLRGVRGATTVEANDRRQIMDRVAEMLKMMVTANTINTEDIGAAIFSATPDLDAAFPATAARTVLGWSEVPLFGTQEIEAANGLPFCIRVLLLWNSAKAQPDINHVYLHGASVLRADAKAGNGTRGSDPEPGDDPR